MWEHNCTSNLVPASRGAAGCTECCSVLGNSQRMWEPAQHPPILEKSHLHKQDGPYVWTSTACLGYRN